MEKILKVSSAFILILALALGFLFLTKNQEIDILKGNCKIKVVYKGIDKGVALDFDEEGNLYLAKEKGIEAIYSNGVVKELIKDDSFKISSMRYLKNKIYYIDRNYFKVLDLNNMETEVLMNNLPTYGQLNETKILASSDNIYISIGTVTNSGVAENLEEKGMVYDLSPKPLTLSGINFGENITGPFLPYGSGGIKGQIINSNFPGNGVVIKYSLKNKKSNLFSWGIKNIKSWDTNSKGEIYSIIEGMDNIGVRAIEGDNDYLYKLEENKWYGWPDYSGGEPITSEKFLVNGERGEFILDNHPTTEIPKAFYNHNNLGSLEALVIDKMNELNKVEKIYFYDKKDKKLSTLTYDCLIDDIITFKDDEDIKDIRIFKNKLYLLSNKKNIIFSVEII
ncbi:hypothetical protein [Clostridium fallax]|uniref:hypothetical protein n=1 Tax=Clostridium fallax TaxID=1533 RepID=UPI0009331369|nr:hypothetical protein [Clostridium fallax]